MYERLKTPYARKMKKLRQSTVEPVLGTLINFLERAILPAYDAAVSIAAWSSAMSWSMISSRASPVMTLSSL
jgi:hypothetical protein